ncbi:hypothetical protein JW824_05270 [bacterium]|nr:hypothetical protein [bacterium]
MTLCRRLNAEPITVINTGHHYSASPQTVFIEEAQHWLEYCNGPATGTVRAANGHPKAYNVKYREIEKELFLTKNASVYVNFVKAFVPALKAIDPSTTISELSQPIQSQASRFCRYHRKLSQIKQIALLIETSCEYRKQLISITRNACYNVPWSFKKGKRS